MHTSSGVILLTLITHLNCELLKLQNGFINGSVAKTKNGCLFQQFYGIPYAEPPVGELRFKPPVAAKSWTDVKDATKFPPKCMQPTKFPASANPVEKQEDCLYLNVFVPNELFKPSGKAPVMVWIHGGAFIKGYAADYNPEYFMDKDVILVTINYRLGILGFFGLNNDVISGNFGLKDQALALQWVKQNIPVFGGDPNNVTLFGVSAGSSSVHLHMFSSLSKGLFQKAIMQSGSAFSRWHYHDEGYGEAVSNTFLVVCGCFRNDSMEILKCLQHLPVEDFVTLESRLFVRNNDASGYLFRPIIESKVNNQPFLPQKPDEKTYQTNVPWITGINSGEGAMFMTKLLLEGRTLDEIVNAKEESIVPLLIWRYLYSIDPEHSNNTMQKIIDFYFDPKKSGSNKAMKLVDIHTDFRYMYPLMKAIKSSHDRKYIYLYDHRGSFSWQDVAGIKLSMDLGVSHADELPILFRNEKLEAKWTPADKIVSEKLLNFWTNFAITGDPNGHSEVKLWNPTNIDGEIEYLHIKSNSATMEKNLLKDRYDFLQSLLH